MNGVKLDFEAVDGHHLDPSDIIDQCEDSEASDLSRPPSIHDLEAEVSRLLDNRSSQSESDHDDGGSSNGHLEPNSVAEPNIWSKEPRNEREYPVVPVVHLDGPPSSNVTEKPDSNAKGGSAIPRLPFLKTTHLVPYPILRLQSSESINLQGGSAQDSRRSSLTSQLSDDGITIKPLDQELEEADQQGEPEQMAVTTSSETGTSGMESSVGESDGEESGGEESGGEGAESESESELWPSWEDIEFQLTGDDPRASTQHDDIITSAAIVTGNDQPHINVRDKEQADIPPTQQLKEMTSLPSKVDAAVPSRVDLEKSTLPGSQKSYPLQYSEARNNIMCKEPSNDMGKNILHVKRFSLSKRQATLPLSFSAEVKTTESAVRQTVSKALPSIQHPSHRSTITGSIDSDSDESVDSSSSDSEEFLPEIPKPIPSISTTPTPPIFTTQKPSTSTTPTPPIFTTPKPSTFTMPTPPSFTKPKPSTFTMPTPPSFTMPTPSIFITPTAVGNQLSDHPKPNESTAILPGAKMLLLPPTPDTGSNTINTALRNRPRSATLPSSSAANRSNKIEPRAGIRTLSPQQVGSTPSLAKVVSSPALPLKGILKKNSRFGSTVSTNTDVQANTRDSDTTSSNSSSKSDLTEHPGSVTSLPAESPPGHCQDKPRPKLQQLGGVWSSTSSSSSEDGEDLDKTLTNEPLHTGCVKNPPSETPAPSIDQLSHYSGNNIISDDKLLSHKQPLLPTDNTSVRKSLKTSPHPGKKVSPHAANRHPLQRRLVSQSSSPSTLLVHKGLKLHERAPKEQAKETNTVLVATTKGEENLCTRVKALEMEHLEMKKVFLAERKALWELITKQNELLSAFHRRRQQDQARFTVAKRHIRSLEAKMVDLEERVLIMSRQIAHQQSMLPSTYQDQDQFQRSEAVNRMAPLVSGKRLAKLTKFFGDAPPILQQFLEKLGYEEHIGKFEGGGVGLPELPHITDRQLTELGIPLGHRIRIIQEARRLSNPSLNN